VRAGVENPRWFCSFLVFCLFFREHIFWGQTSAKSHPIANPSGREVRCLCYDLLTPSGPRTIFERWPGHAGSKLATSHMFHTPGRACHSLGMRKIGFAACCVRSTTDTRGSSDQVVFATARQFFADIND